jgi:hypothetical protein
MLQNDTERAFERLGIQHVLMVACEVFITYQ